jgi:phosphate transport system substrate-binding protein
MRKLMNIMLSLILIISLSFSAVKELTGAGASFPYPLYSKMFSVYAQEKGINVNYQKVGSGSGIKAIKNKLVDFGASDAFLDNKKLKGMPYKTLHIPTCLGAVSLTYNLPGNPSLKFTPEIIAGIFLGEITNWNDKKITEVNPGVKLPDQNITVVHRSDSSGTTAIFTDYLAKVSKSWKKKVGPGQAVNWPVGLGGKKNDGVSALVKQTPGAVGYVELIYAISNDMPVAKVQNSSGNYIMPALESVSLAADVKIPKDSRVSLTDTKAPAGYPISGFTWLLIYQEQSYNGRSQEQAKATVDLIWWMTHEGQRLNSALHYGELPDAAKQVAEDILKSVTYKGTTLL